MRAAIGDFQWVRDEPVIYLTLPQWRRQAGILAAVSTRHGGVSQGPFATLNLGFNNRDEAWRVQENRNRFFRTLGLEKASMVAGHQVHGTEIAIISREHAGGQDGELRTLPRCDGLMTDDPGFALTAFVADCIPLFVADPGAGAIGVAHAGWRGSIAGIAPGMVAAFQRCYGSRPERLLVALGPSIGPCCYEVGPEVALAVKALGEWTGALLRRHSPERWFMDLRALNRGLLERAGVLPQHVVQADYCTRCHHQDFFSYRAQNGHTGSLAGVIARTPLS